jgi:hypothetical protein
MLTDTTYQLDLPALLQLLRDHAAVLSTTIDIPPIEKPCYGYLSLRNRNIIDCQVQSRDGTVLYRGQEAYRILSTKIHWQVRTTSTLDRSTKSSQQQERSPQITRTITSVPDAYVPHTIASLEPPVLQKYTMQQRLIIRTVFVMINGQRSVSQMKENLRLSSESINEALTSLKAIGVIE